MKVDWLIVGAGFTGATVAERIASQLNKKVLIIDRRDHIGGNAYDCYDEHGLLVSEYGPHIFHTNSRKVWDYLSAFTQWRPYFHEVLASIDGQQVPVPFNLNSLHALFPATQASRLEELLVKQFGLGDKVPVLRFKESSEPEIKRLAEFVYEKVFHGYTLKQWELRPDQLDPGVTGRVPIHVSRDNRYFQDTYQATPSQGYTEMFRRMLGHRNIKVLLNADFREVSGDIEYERMVYTGEIDSFFEFRHGELPYRSLRFEVRVLDQEWHQPVATVNYPNEFDFTRITEQKRITGQKHPKTALVVEYPMRHIPGQTEPYYPVPRDENRERYALYAKDAAGLSGKVLFAGRLADYKYYNMDQAVARALTLFEKTITPLVKGTTPLET
jgi:UDP-galactopyranose mutase